MAVLLLLLSIETMPLLLPGMSPLLLSGNELLLLDGLGTILRRSGIATLLRSGTAILLLSMEVILLLTASEIRLLVSMEIRLLLSSGNTLKGYVLWWAGCSKRSTTEELPDVLEDGGPAASGGTRGSVEAFVGPRLLG
ncbi:unnamed protein product [Durusdinium trenchii]|uniref:Uncharacterized protein n=1 Tax=Durusdinium trenchii TaxID=1381693 RepID=A0ABP0P745_9DINO